MIAKEIMQRTDEELLTLERTLTSDLFQFRMQNATGQPDMGRIRRTRRDLARVKTVITARGVVPTKGTAASAPAGKGEER